MILLKKPIKILKKKKINKKLNVPLKQTMNLSLLKKILKKNKKIKK